MGQLNNYRNAMEWTLAKLSNTSKNANEDFEKILTTITQINPKELNEKIINEDNLSDEELQQLQIAVEKRATGEPFSYIFNSCVFLSYKFFIDKNCFIPRAETITLVSYVIENITNPKLKILDLGTGCGIIGLSLAHHNPTWQISLSDISDAILEVAKQNANNFSLTNIDKYIKSDWLNDINDTYDLIISNPPYAKTSSIDKNSFEPKLSIDGGETGLDPTKAILAKAASKLNNNGLLILETSTDHIPNILKILDTSKLKHVITIKDKNHFDRAIILQKVKELV